jgi:hypothetical protein
MKSKKRRHSSMALRYLDAGGLHDWKLEHESVRFAQARFQHMKHGYFLRET